ncbi:thiamine pyrophosphate-binding protein, partial [Achromobacter insuavis]
MDSMNDRLHPSVAAALAAPETPPANGARILLETLIAHGVDTVFGYPGGAVLPLYDALYAEPRLRHVLVRHEQAAVHAAEGYARTTGRTGVVFVTSGPGMANTTSGLLDAMCDSIPVLCISGQVATSAIGTDAFQECDAIGISRSVTKWNTQVRSVDDVAAVTARAFELTRQGRPGPVLLDFPKDVQLAVPRDADGDDDTPSQQKLAALRARRQSGKLAPKLPQSAVRRAAALIAQAKRP